MRWRPVILQELRGQQGPWDAAEIAHAVDWHGFDTHLDDTGGLDDLFRPELRGWRLEGCECGGLRHGSRDSALLSCSAAVMTRTVLCSRNPTRSAWSDRRERDSNPRYGFPYSDFQDRRLQPLGHPSVVGIIAAACDMQRPGDVRSKKPEAPAHDCQKLEGGSSARQSFLLASGFLLLASDSCDSSPRADP
jgi:hypothetical protein